MIAGAISDRLFAWLGQCILWVFLPLAGFAQPLALPNSAQKTQEVSFPTADYALPISGWSDDGGVLTRDLRGHVSNEAWRIEAASQTPLQLLTPLRQSLQDSGYEILFECSDVQCGGFDFRFAIEVLPAPEMRIDLTDYHFLSAVSADGESHIALLTSRGAVSLYLQITRIGPEATNPITTAPTSDQLTSPQHGSLASHLENKGHVILSDLAFETGSSQLGAGEFESLSDLAKYLKAHPNRRILLVGHTDSIGSLDNNVALSRRRAQSVADRLVARFEISRDQIGAEGTGYLSPVASNLTQEGRTENRRVEAVLVSVE